MRKNVDDLKNELTEVVGGQIRDPADAKRVQAAAGLLGELLELERRAETLLADDPQVSPGGSLAGLTLHAAAERVLDDGGVPLHARELGVRIKARGWIHPRSRVGRPHQIVRQLAARLPKHPEVFRRVAPQTFALVKWGKDSFPGPRAEPRLGLFRGPGTGVAGRIGESGEAIESGDAEWRSS